MNQFYTAESVTEGHPDKLCDLIADSVLDECLSHDALSRVACEVLATRGQIIVAGEITSLFEPRIPAIARSVLQKAGYDPARYAIQCLVHKQSPDISAGVDCSLECRRNPSEDQPALQLGAGDQGVMVGYACSETPQMMPLPVVLAHRLTSALTAARKTGMIRGLRPDGKAQVTVEYDEDEKPLRLDTVVLSTQHTPEKPMDELCWELTDKVLAPALQALPPDEDTKILLNPSGRFVLGGPEADTGLTGRKLMVDSYGVFAPHGGGAFSGKDPTKMDRSGAYMARYIAKNLVSAGLCEKCQVTLAYSRAGHGGGGYLRHRYGLRRRLSGGSGAVCVRVDPSGDHLQTEPFNTKIHTDSRLWAFRQIGVSMGAHRSGENPAGGCHLTGKEHPHARSKRRTNCRRPTNDRH